MKTTHNQTLSLLQKLKHQKFSSQTDPNLKSLYQNNKSNFDAGINNGFKCSYHANETITNFCISDGEDKPKPLCPRCLQQHMKTHQQRSTTCKLQTAETELQRIKFLLSQRLSKCSNLNEKILSINEWKSQSVEDMKFQLIKYKRQINQSIQKLFMSIESQLLRKYQQQNSTYEQIVKMFQISLPDLRQISTRSLNNLCQNNDLNNVLLALPQITQKYNNMINNQKKMIDNCSTNPQLRFNRSKLTQAMNFIKQSLQYKFNKINQYELEQKLKKLVRQKFQQLKSINEQKTLSKLQKLVITNKNSTSKLHTIDKPKLLEKQQNYNQQRESKQIFSYTVPSSPRNFNKTYQSTNSIIQNLDKDMLQKLNNTTNRLKSSLNGFYNKTNKNDVYR